MGNPKSFRFAVANHEAATSRQAPQLAIACQPATLHGCSPLASVDPASVIALVSLGASGVMALWKIANGLGRFESRTTTILEGVQVMLKDHEDRLRNVESKL